MTNKSEGWLLFGVGTCMGSFQSYNTKVEMCKIKNLSDYESVL